MADPIVQIKRRTTTPARPLAMTEGELACNLSDSSFYIINNSSSAITFGTRIDSSTSLSSNSDNRIATQNAIKTYVDSLNTSSGLQYHMRETNTALPINGNNDTIIVFGSEITNNITGLNYSGGTFTNSTGITMCLHIDYVIPRSNTSALGFFCTWIQTTGEKAKTKYGGCYQTTNGNPVSTNFTTLNSGSAIIALSPSTGFSICAAIGRGTTGTAIVSNAISNADEENKAKVNIFKF
jgi:hypothetical protein